jgi:hypothetical protein
MANKKLRTALEKLLKEKEDPFSRFLPEGSGLNTLEDVGAVRWALEELAKMEPMEAARTASEVVGLFQEIGKDQREHHEELVEELSEVNPEKSREELLEFVEQMEDEVSGEAVRGELLEPLLQLEERFAEALAGGVKKRGDKEKADDVDEYYWLKRADLFMLKQIACFGDDSAIKRIVERARGFESEHYMWAVILGAFTQDHPQHEELFAALSSPIPEDFIGICLLDAANAARIAGSEFRHPFDHEEGWNRLRELIREVDPEKESYAQSATAALPFLSEPGRTELLELALDHPSETVSVEAAWAAAKIGSARGVRQLAEFAKRVNTAKVALAYLAEVGREDAIPEQAKDPDFLATAEMVNWLKHPNEFGEAPESIDLYDTRELYWPPTEDVRKVWLFKYRYPKTEQREVEDVGLGMVGSVTFALFGEATKDLEPLDAYALHCCWEFERNEDPRAPKERTIAAGRRLLKEYNDI